MGGYGRSFQKLPTGRRLVTATAGGGQNGLSNRIGNGRGGRGQSGLLRAENGSDVGGEGGGAEGAFGCRLPERPGGLRRDSRLSLRSHHRCGVLAAFRLLRTCE